MLLLLITVDVFCLYGRSNLLLLSLLAGVGVGVVGVGLLCLRDFAESDPAGAAYNSISLGFRYAYAAKRRH